MLGPLEEAIRGLDHTAFGVQTDQTRRFCDLHDHCSFFHQVYLRPCIQATLTYGAHLLYVGPLLGNCVKQEEMQRSFRLEAANRGLAMSPTQVSLGLEIVTGCQFKIRSYFIKNPEVWPLCNKSDLAVAGARWGPPLCTRACPLEATQVLAHF